MDNDKLDLSRFLNDYLNDAKEGFQESFTALLALEKEIGRTELLDDIFRPVHTLKSSSTMLEFMEIAETAHIAEDLLDCMKSGNIPVTKEIVDLLFTAVETLEDMVRQRAEGKGGSAEPALIVMKMRELLQHKEMHEHATADPEKAKTPRLMIEKVETVRVRVDLLDSLFNMVGELIITKNRIDNITADMERKDLKTALTDMKRIISTLQENVSTARMVPVDEIFQKFPRMVRDIAKEQNKELNFIIKGNEIELDKGLIDALSEPLIHLLRNAIDHGIEHAEERLKLNKKPEGTIKLIAQRTENHILIDVEDDGQGIDIEKMKDIAVKKGFATPEEAALMEDRQVLNILFRPGFSSAGQVTGLSGRGVGLDIALTSAKKMGGMVEVATQKGQGTRFSLKLPLTTAIIQTLMISLGEKVFAIPSEIVLETLDVNTGEIRGIGENSVLVLRGEVLPFIRLQDLLNIPMGQDRDMQTAIIIQRADKFIAIGVDAVLNQMENIIKPFDPIAQQFKGFSGGIIQGDGSIALMLDIPSLVNLEAMKEEKY